MNVLAVDKTKNIFSKKPVKFVVWVVVLAVLAYAAYYVYNTRFKTVAKAPIKQQTATVKKGDFAVTVSGSGPINSSNKVEVSSKVSNGTVTKIYHKEGDTVKAGELLFELDDSSAKVNVEKIRANIAQTELTLRNNGSDVAKLRVTAPFSGQVSNLSVKQGDYLNKNANILTLIDQSKFKLTVPFNSSIISEIIPGKNVIVNVQNLMQSVEGTVTYVNNKSFSTSTGGELYNVEITVNNPGSLREGMNASAEIQTSKGPVSSTSAGPLSYVNSQVIRTDTGGTLNKLIVKDGQFVNAGEVLAELSNDDLILQKDSTDVKLLDYKGQLDSAQQELSYYKIYAPIDGTIVKLNEKEGNVVKGAEVLATMADGNQLECVIPIDELDIAKIKVGQKATVIVDALPESATAPLSGEVSKIAIEGNYSNGVTTYPVTVKILKPDNLRGGMNANVDVSVASKSKALFLPIEAVQKIKGKTFVMVKGEDGAAPTQTPGKESKNTKDSKTDRQAAKDGKEKDAKDTNPQSTDNTIVSSSGGLGYSGGKKPAVNAATDNSAMALAKGNPQLAQYYANVTLKPVDVGINNETYIEIVNGLSEGDEVILPPKTTNQNSGVRIPTGGAMGGMFGGGGASQAVRR